MNRNNGNEQQVTGNKEDKSPSFVSDLGMSGLKSDP